ncbi:MAG: hypothetical protein OEY28_13525, partial [Nitrospira sp.]|nr:hypothetical protein [Nitrospira sp.]
SAPHGTAGTDFSQVWYTLASHTRPEFGRGAASPLQKTLRVFVGAGPRPARRALAPTSTNPAESTLKGIGSRSAIVPVHRRPG